MLKLKALILFVKAFRDSDGNNAPGWAHHLWKVDIITFWVLEIDQLIFCTNDAYPKWAPDLDTSIRDIEMKIWIMCAKFLLLEIY